MSTQVADLVARLRADASGYVAGVTQAIAVTDAFKTKVAGLSSVGQGLSQFGSTMTRFVTLPMGLAGGAAAKLSLNFEQEMAKIEGLAGVPRTQIKGLSDDIKSLAGETTQAPQDLAKAMYFITSGGIKAANATGVLTASAKAATSGLGNVKDVSYAVVSAMNAFSAQGLTAAHATDVMVAGAKAATFETDQLVGSMGRVLPIAAAMGISFDDTVAGLSSLSQGGLDAHQSTTALLNVLTHILHPVGAAGTAFQKVFGSVTEAQRTLREEGLGEFLVGLQEGLDGSSAAVADLFPDVRGLIGILNFLNDDGKKTQAVFQDMSDVVGDSEKAFESMSRTAGFDVAQGFAEMKVALIAFGEAAAPAIRMFADAIRETAEFLGGLPDPAKKTLIALGALAAVMGPLALGAGAFIRAGVAIVSILPSATAGTTALSAAQGAAAGTATVQAVATARLAGALRFATGAAAALAGGFMLGSAAGNKINDWLDGSRPKVDDLTASILGYNTALATGAAPPEFDFERYADDFRKMIPNEGFTPKGVFNFARSVVSGPDSGAHKAKKDIEDLNKAFLNILASQGPEKATLAFGQFSAQLGQLGIDSATVAAAMGPFFSKLNLAEAEAKAAGAALDTNAAKATIWGEALGGAGSEAAMAMAAYDAAMGNATEATDSTREAGRGAAVALRQIGVAAHFAASATVEGMSAAEGAVAGLFDSMQQSMDIEGAGQSLLSSMQALQDAQSGDMGGGGGGGAGKTAVAAALDQAQKELALRDAQREVANSTMNVWSAGLQLAQARVANRSATETLISAEQRYREVLNGVAADSDKARTAVMAFQQAKNDQAGSQLDVRAAQRALQQAKNDKGLYEIAVREAREKLRQSKEGSAGGGIQQWVQTPTGSKLQPTGGAEAGSQDQIRKDQIALNNALIAATGANDSVLRAQLALSNAQLSGKQKTKDLSDANRTLNGTLKGYAAGSKEAKEAAKELRDAQLGVVSSSLGIISAKDGVVGAHNDIATAALNLKRMQADLRGELESTGGAMRTLRDHSRNVASATLDVKRNLVGVAEALASKEFNKETQAVEWGKKFLESLKALKDYLNPQGELMVAFDDLLKKWKEILDPAPPKIPTKKDLQAGDWNFNFASGGPMPSADPGGFPIVAHPGEYMIQAKAVQKYGKHMMDLLNAGALPTFAVGGLVGGDRGGSSRIVGSDSGGGTVTIHQHFTQLRVEALDPQTAGPIVVKALRDEYGQGGPISGVGFTP